MGNILSCILQGPIPAYTKSNSSVDSSKGDRFHKTNGFQKTDEESSVAATVGHYLPPDPITSSVQSLLDDAKLLHGRDGKDASKLKQKMAMKAKKLTGELLGPEAMIGGMAVAMGELGATYQFMAWKIFDHIPNEGSISYKELADVIEADESLVTRIGGMLVSTGRLTHAGPKRVSHSKFSPMFKSDHHAGNLFRVMFEHGLRGYTHWTDYFADYGNREPAHSTHNPFTYSWGQADLSVWQVLEQDAEKQRVFDAAMGSENSISQTYGGPTEVYDFGWVAEAAKKTEGKVLVDVGGNRGKTVQAILDAVPGIPRERCVVQDLPEVIEGAMKDGDLDLRGIQMMGHDFKKEQTVKGALVYLLRRVLHNHSDDTCVEVLSHLAAALPIGNSQARVIIMDQIVSDPPTPRNAAADMIMLNIGGKERTPANFENIAKRAGLKVVKFHRLQGVEVGAVECARAA